MSESAAEIVYINYKADCPSCIATPTVQSIDSGGGRVKNADHPLHRVSHTCRPSNEVSECRRAVSEHKAKTTWTRAKDLIGTTELEANKKNGIESKLESLERESKIVFFGKFGKGGE